MHRREFLRIGGGVLLGSFLGSALWTRPLGAATAVSGPNPYGALLPPDANGVQLPPGFRSRVVARSGRRVSGSRYTWHAYPDGGAVFPAPGGHVYVSNSEVSSAGGGGVGAIRFDAGGEIVDAYSICSGTTRNCAGGATPWGTWLSCEEFDAGHVYECDPTGRAAQAIRPALGTFTHEACAADPLRRQLYLTEDESDGLLYRFTPTTWGDLGSGLLEGAQVRGGRVSWHAIPKPNPARGDDPTRAQVSATTGFDGGEGIVYHDGRVFFSTKGDDRVWDYDVATGAIRVLYDASRDPGEQLTGVDGIAVSRSGDLFVAEDGGNMELVMLTPDRVASPLLRIPGEPSSEISGPAFDLLGRRLYFSSQRGGAGGRGVTYEVTGPFRASTG